MSAAVVLNSSLWGCDVFELWELSGGVWSVIDMGLTWGQCLDQIRALQYVWDGQAVAACVVTI